VTQTNPLGRKEHRTHLAIPAPSAVGAFFAAIVATGYVIFDAQQLHLWTPASRSVVMGGAAFVLLTYFLSWSFIEADRSLQSNLVAAWPTEYLLRTLAQFLLALSLAAVGVNFGLYLFLFGGFVGVSFLWSLWVRRIPGLDSVKDLFWHDTANLVLCALYVGISFRLYRYALDFENSYAAFSRDAFSFGVRLRHLRGETSDVTLALGIVVGFMMCNVIVLLIRSRWIKLSVMGSTPKTTPE
jgi:hypothetical protein